MSDLKAGGAARSRTGSVRRATHKDHGTTEASASITSLARSALQRLAHSKADRGTTPSALSEPDVRAFVALLLDSDVTGADRIIRCKQALGSSHTDIADGLLSAAARMLGKRWDDDDLSFPDVSLGISTLFRVNALLRTGGRPLRAADGPRALFVTLSNQTHTLGIILAAEAFRRSGWDVDLRLEVSNSEVLEAAVREKVSLVGFTAGRDTSLREIVALTRQLKALSTPPKVLVGGVAPNISPGEVGQTGVDVITDCIEGALARASELFKGAAHSG